MGVGIVARSAREVAVSRAARSVQVFAIYLEGLAVMLIFAPNRLLDVFGVANTHEVWIRLVGVLVGIIGAYYLVAVRAGFRPMFVASVPVRLALSASFVTFVAFDLAEPAILVFGLADLLGAIWTAAALRADGADPAAG